MDLHAVQMQSQQENQKHKTNHKNKQANPTNKTNNKKVMPVSDSVGYGDAHLVAAQGSGRLSALTVHQATPASS